MLIIIINLCHFLNKDFFKFEVYILIASCLKVSSVLRINNENNIKLMKFNNDVIMFLCQNMYIIGSRCKNHRGLFFFMNLVKENSELKILKKNIFTFRRNIMVNLFLLIYCHNLCKKLHVIRIQFLLIKNLYLNKIVYLRYYLPSFGTLVGKLV